MALDQMLRNRKPQSGAAAATGAVGLVEALENVGNIIGWDTGAGIPNPERDPISLHSGTNRDLAATRSKGQCILQEIEEHLLNACGVDDDDGQVCRQFQINRATPLLRLCRHPVCNGFQKRAQLTRGRV